MPTRGMERWLTQRLSDGLGASPGRRDGVCANVDFPSPRALVGDAVAAGSGLEPDADPWLPERMVWPLLEVVDGRLGEPWLATLAAPPAAAAPTPARARGSPPCATSPSCFDRYALHRPELIVRAWARRRGRRATGRPSCGGGCASGSARPDPAERLEGACARLARRAGAARPAAAALALRPHPPAGRRGSTCCARSRPRRDVHLFLLHPSPALWARIAGGSARPGGEPRATDPTATLPRNRLLASWGHDVRELQLVLAAAGEHVAHHHAAPPPAPSLLARDPGRRPRRRDAPGPPLPGVADARPLLDPDDRSVAGPRLPRPRAAGRGAARRDPAPARRRPDARAARRDRDVPGHRDVRAADPRRRSAPARRGGGRRRPRPRPPDCACGWPTGRCARRTRCSASSARLLDLAGERLTASQVLDLADREPVRRRFRFDDDDLARLEDWVARGRRPLGPRRRRTGRRSSSSGSPRAPGAPGSTGCWSGWRWPRTTAAVRRACSRSTTSTAARSTSPGGSPSWSTGSARRSPRCAAPQPIDAWADGARRGGRRADRRAGARRLAARASSSGCSTTWSRRRDGRRAGRRSRSRRSAPCWPTASRAGRPARTSARAT